MLDDARLGHAERVAILDHVAGALAYVHARGITHRDLKPENVLVANAFFDEPTRPGAVRLIDFGIAAPVGNPRPLTREGSVVGTDRYLPPELLSSAARPSGTDDGMARGQAARETVPFRTLIAVVFEQQVGIETAWFAAAQHTLVQREQPHVARRARIRLRMHEASAVGRAGVRGPFGRDVDFDQVLVPGNRRQRDGHLAAGVRIEVQLRDRRVAGLDVDVHYQDTSGWYSNYRIGETTAASKILVDRATDQIVGAHLLGPEYGELINIIGLAMKLKLTTRQLKSMTATYPTVGSDLGSML